MVVGEVLGIEAAHKQRGHQRNTKETSQGFLQRRCKIVFQMHIGQKFASPPYAKLMHNATAYDMQ